ncbi:MAG: peptidylprolyl isomerase [Bacteroidales bacterium]|nr:peptidylprolyl isomerase [Bacteroidales bacterium]
MKKVFAIMAFAALMLPATISHAQQDPVIFEVNGQKILKSEFMKEFLRSQGKSEKDAPTPCTYEKRQALEEYVDLFVNYRTKLADAYAMGLDTMQALNKELKMYRDELAAPYLIDSATMENILREAYERNHYAVHASHILIRVGAGDSAEDTLKAYNKAMDYYQRAVNGEDFTKLAQQSIDEQREKVAGERFQIDPNAGDLGCFTVFDMLYPFENAAYTTEPGTVSKPVRSRYGYHVVKVHERVPYYGNVKLSHIWVRDDQNPGRAEARINMAYEGLESGKTFIDMARQHSDDMNTNQGGGFMGELELKQLPPDYVVQLSKGLKAGEYSKPFKTKYGWHIIKVVSREEIPSYEEMVSIYKQKLSRDQRSKDPRAIYAANAKKRYNFEDLTTTYALNKKGKPTKNTLASLDQLKSLITDSVFYKRWTFDSTQITDLRPIMRLAGKEYTQVDLGKYIEMRQTKELRYDLPMYVQYKYKDYADEVAIEYANSHLEEENADFANLIEEYRHGMMIFSYNELMIWGKAIKDSVGFAQFYERQSKTKSLDNADDAPFFWNLRARVKTIDVDADAAAMLPQDKALKIVNKSIKKNWSSQKLESELAGKGTAKAKIDLKVVEQGKQSLLGDNEWKEGVIVHPSDKGYSIVVVEKIMEPDLKNLTEARGYYMNEYQNEIERQLNQSLRKKYNVKIHQDVVDGITY